MVNYLFPIFNSFYERFAEWLPEFIVICILGALCGVSAMGVYYLFSNQKAIKKLKQDARELRIMMRNPDLEYSEFFKYALRNIIVSFRLFLKTLGPAFVSLILVGIVVSWFSTYKTYASVERKTPIKVEIVPSSEKVTFYPPEAFIQETDEIEFLPQKDSVQIGVMTGPVLTYSGTPNIPPTRSIKKKSWFNLILASEVGYLRSNSSLQEIKFNFKRKIFLSSVPIWMAIWEFPFFLCLTIVTILMKFLFRIN